MKKVLITESEENNIREMYGFGNTSKPRDKSEGIDHAVISSMKELIPFFSSRKFYDKLNNLLGFDVMSKYGPVDGLYKTLENNNIVFSRDEDGEIVLNIEPKEYE